MTKIHTPLALALAMTLGAAAHADTLESTGDVYQESVWNVQADLHADAKPAAGQRAEAGNDLYEESVWDIHASFGPDAFATQSASLRTASTRQTGAGYGGADTPYRERDEGAE